jgi:hypothetical protein
MTQALALLKRLHAWERNMGGCENQVWRDLEEFLGVAKAPDKEPDPDNAFRQVKNYLENCGSKCFFCESENVERGSTHIDGAFSRTDVYCLVCEATWTDVYKLITVELSSVDDDE